MSQLVTYWQVGSHLDSVPAGPGINDNGSGSMANLEMAIQLAKSGKKPTNQVLFAFWGAEELGLLGSRHFVKRLAEDGTISDVALNLNFDMIVRVTEWMDNNVLIILFL